MNEKGLQILEQYDIQLLRSFGGRGAVMLETEQGLKVLKEFAGSKNKLLLEQLLLQKIEEQGICRTDLVMANREGELISQGEYETQWILKNWPQGKECDPRNEVDLLESMHLLAQVHSTARGVWKLQGEERDRMQGLDRRVEFEKHNREMKRVQNFIRARHKKGEFERLYLTAADRILNEGRAVLTQLLESGYEDLLKRAFQEGHICHGEYVHHHIFRNRQEYALVNFQHCEINVQVNDICLFLRKIMEKQNWNEVLARRMLEAYEKERLLSGEERRYLALCLSYPEKVWKLAHHYYNTNKAWVPEKSAEKLEVFLAQEEQRRNWVKAVLL